MDPHLGDSSSDSDLSNSWSIVDQELCTTEITQRDNSVDKESLSGSDGDSLEVIEDEEKRDTDEFRDADIETDGISIITESEINEELDQTLAWTEPKEKKYLHHPNTYLNSRLNVLLAISLAAVFGLGLGHFLGLQEECPLLNESVTAQIEKLQQENEQLRSQLEKLLHNEVTASMALRTALDLTCKNDECLMQKQTSKDLVENQNYVRENYWNLPSSDISHLKDEPAIIKETAPDPISRSAEETRVSTQDYLRNLEPEWVRTYPWPKAPEVGEEEVSSESKDNVNNKQSNLKVAEEAQHFYNEAESLDFENKASIENEIAEDHVSLKHKVQQMKEQLSHDRKDNGIEAVRMALSLLESHFTLDDRTSPDAKDTLSSAQSLTSDLEQSLVELQTAITSSEVEHSGFFGQVLKKMKESVNRVMNTLEEVADDVDEQMHKVLYRLTRKLKKLKGKLHERWCNLSEKYSNKSHAVLNWLRSKILVDCKKLKDNPCESKTHRPKGGNYNKNAFPSLPLEDGEDKELPESLRHAKSSYFGKIEYSDCKEYSVDSILLKPKDGNDEPLILDSPIIIAESVSEPEQTMTTFHIHDKHISYDKFTNEKLNSEIPCWQTQHGTMYCEKHEKKHAGSAKESLKKSKKEEKASQKKTKNAKPVYKVEDMGKAKTEEQINEYVRSKPVEQKGWDFPDVNNNVQNNASGDWMMKLAKGRAEQRELAHKSDWVFDRAHSRRIQRDIDKKKAQWYFQRAHGREYCRYHPQSEDCQNIKSHTFQWDGSNTDKKYRKHYTENKSHYLSKWSKKFGKWVKNSFSNWHKVKYHSQH